MALSLLKTKLYIPPVRSNLVQRTRLIERLNECARPGCRLTLVSAPAGFGKTTLLAHWIQQTDRDVAWLSLDAGDNDLAQFWSYVVSAQQILQPGLGQAALAVLQSPQPPPIESVLTDLVNEMTSTDSAWTLVLDDYHVIIDPAINDSLAFLIDHLPSQMHLVLASRADPPWPLARLRARQALVELRTEDLRFTLEEASTFLNAAMGLDLSPQDVALLDERTEGWIAGLQLAALAMQGTSMQGQDDVTTFVQAFSGNHRFVLDYLVEEVLARQPDDIRAFLIQTSILGRLCAPLCDALMQREDSQTVLAQLEQNNLFLVPLDDQRRWYRYHRLFADLLSSRLSQDTTERVSILHRRASEWYEAQELVAEAIEHGLQGDDLQRVGQLIAGNALAMMEHGQLPALKRLLETVPPSTVLAHPWLSLAQAWIYTFTGQLDDVEPLLQAIESTLSDSKADTKSKQMIGHIAAIRAGIPFMHGNTAQAVENARTALIRLPAHDLGVRSWVTMILGLCLGWQLHLEEAERVFRQALDISRAHRASHVTLWILCNLGSTQEQRGRLIQAADTFRQVMELGQELGGRSGQPPPIIGYAYVYLADILREWNDLPAALEYIERGIQHCVQWGEPELLTGAYLIQARVYFSVGDQDGARDAIQGAKRAAGSVSNWYVDRAAVHEIELLLALGEITEAAHKASRLIYTLAPESPTNLSESVLLLTLIRLAIAQGETDQALKSISKLLALYQSANGLDGQIKTLVQKSIALQMQGKRAPALAALRQALSLAEPEGYVRTFVEAGAPLDGLLRQALAQGIAPAYVRKLLDAWTDPTIRKSVGLAQAPAPLLDPLTDRELEVLRLLPTHLSSTDIARQLYVSKNTVRSHIGHIYDKLGVHSREDAVQRAQELGLLLSGL